MRYIFCIFILFVSLSVSYAATDDGDQDKIFRVREAFIYNFLKFAAWPENRSYLKTGEYNICVMGDHEFAEHFKQRNNGLIQEIKVHILEQATDDKVSSCHILFIGKAAEEHLAIISAHTLHHPVLTISEISNFADHSGIIEIAKGETKIGLFSKDKVNLRINIKNAQDSGLDIDARLLQIATEVIK